MRATITIDKAGRVVLPKAVRDQLHLMSGDSLELHADGEKLTLQPVRAAGTLVRKDSFLVFRGEGKSITVEDTNRVVREIQDEREAPHAGLPE